MPVTAIGRDVSGPAVRPTILGAPIHNPITVMTIARASAAGRATAASGGRARRRLGRISRRRFAQSTTASCGSTSPGSFRMTRARTMSASRPAAAAYDRTYDRAKIPPGKPAKFSCSRSWSRRTGILVCAEISSSVTPLAARSSRKCAGANRAPPFASARGEFDVSTSSHNANLTPLPSPTGWRCYFGAAAARFQVSGRARPPCDQLPVIVFKSSAMRPSKPPPTCFITKVSFAPSRVIVVTGMPSAP